MSHDVVQGSFRLAGPRSAAPAQTAQALQLPAPPAPPVFGRQAGSVQFWPGHPHAPRPAHPEAPRTHPEPRGARLPVVPASAPQLTSQIQRHANGNAFQLPAHLAGLAAAAPALARCRPAADGVGARRGFLRRARARRPRRPCDRGDCVHARLEPVLRARAIRPSQPARPAVTGARTHTRGAAAGGTGEESVRVRRRGRAGSRP